MYHGYFHHTHQMPVERVLLITLDHNLLIRASVDSLTCLTSKRLLYLVCTSIEKEFDHLHVTLVTGQSQSGFLKLVAARIDAGAFRQQQLHR